MGARVGVAGASGYAGGELLRLLAGHPDLEIGPLTAGSNVGAPVTSVHPNLIGLANRTFGPADPAALAGADLVFMTMPHAEAAALAGQLPAETRVVDLGAGFRLTDPAQWARFYGGEHAGHWTYGLPELPGAREQIRASVTVASPGCYATASILALAPLLTSGLAEPRDIVIVAASGTSGAGRAATASLMGSEVMGAVSAYKVGGVHRHTPEIEQALQAVLAPGAGGSQNTVTISFTPTLAPMPRGILATATARLAGPAARGGARRGRVGGHRAAARGGRGLVRGGDLRAPAARGPVAQHRGDRRLERGPAPGGRGRARRTGRRRRGDRQPRQGRGRPGAAERQPHARPARIGRPHRVRSRTVMPLAPATPAAPARTAAPAWTTTGAHQ